MILLLSALSFFLFKNNSSAQALIANTRKFSDENQDIALPGFLQHLPYYQLWIFFYQTSKGVPSLVLCCLYSPVYWILK